jgi:hypothetical protein
MMSNVDQVLLKWFTGTGILVSPPTAENFAKQTEHKKLHM